MHITYDPEADAAYITVVDRIAEGESHRQHHSIPVPSGAGELIVDYDAAGFLLGIEVLGASSVLRPEVLDNAPSP